jgi:hypothetical protein
LQLIRRNESESYQAKRRTGANFTGNCWKYPDDFFAGRSRGSAPVEQGVYTQCRWQYPDAWLYYAVGSTSIDNAVVYKSVNGGSSWSLNDDVNSFLGIAYTDMVAVAPDDPNIAVVVDATSATPRAWVTTNGGSTWSNLGTIGASAIYDVSISSAANGIHYIAIAGNNSVWYFPLGAAAPAWKNMVTSANWSASAPAVSSFQAVAFSPNFTSDNTVLAVAFNAGNNAIELHAANFNSYTWDSAIGFFEGYPANIADSNTIIKVSISLSPNYNGGDETMRTAFIGLAGTSGSSSYDGIVRMSNTFSKQLMASATAINSVDYNGSVLVSGQYDTNTTWYCTDPLAVTPTVSPARSYKRPGIDSGALEKVVVKWYGEKVIAAVRGAMGAFSVSIDNGLTWNDISLENYTLTDITDLYVAQDGSKWYFGVNDGANSAVYRYDGSWARVLNLAGARTLMLRAAPSAPDTLYAAMYGNTTIYYTADAGQTRWFDRNAPGAIADLAAESADVVYVGTGTAVRKSANQGFTWGGPTYPFSTDSVYSLYSLSANNLIVGGNAGHVSYSTDGGANFTKIGPGVPGATNVMAIADNLGAGGHIYAACTNNDDVYRYVIGVDTIWKDLLAPNTTGGVSTGIALAGGIIYVSTTAADILVNRDTYPTADTPSPVFWDAAGITNTAPVNADRTPWALKTSSGSVKLWVINNTPVSDTIYSYDDTLADTAPTLIAPVNNYILPINTVTGYPYPFTFTWTRPSLATSYQIFIAFDPDMTQLATAPIMTGFSTFDTNSYMWAPGVMAPGTYYWGVAAISPVKSRFSEIRSFSFIPQGPPVSTSVVVDAPDFAPYGYSFPTTINIHKVSNLSTCSYNVLFDPTILALNSVTGGNINGTPVPVSSWNETTPGTVTISQTIADISGASGSGYLAKLQFTVISQIGKTAEIDFGNRDLVDITGQPIPSMWINDVMYTTPFILGDVNGDGVVNVLDMTKIARIILGLD